MTDHIKGFIVTLDTDLRADDAEALRAAICHLRHVATVEPVVADVCDHMNRERVRQQLVFDMLKVLERKL
jgi:hypothetical protein